MGWKAIIRTTADNVEVLVMDQGGEDVLKARLPQRPVDVQSLPRLLEGVALWERTPLCAAISVDADAPVHPVEAIFGAGSPWPPETELVHYRLLRTARRGRRIRGPGNCRALYRLIERWDQS